MRDGNAHTKRSSPTRGLACGTARRRYHVGDLQLFTFPVSNGNALLGRCLNTPNASFCRPNGFRKNISMTACALQVSPNACHVCIITGVRSMLGNRAVSARSGLGGMMLGCVPRNGPNVPTYNGVPVVCRPLGSAGVADSDGAASVITGLGFAYIGMGLGLLFSPTSSRVRRTLGAGNLGVGSVATGGLSRSADLM